MEAEGKLAGADFEPQPGPVEGAIDRIHLARMTLGDKTLEGEVLALFDRQAGRSLAQLGEHRVNQRLSSPPRWQAAPARLALGRWPRLQKRSGQ